MVITANTGIEKYHESERAASRSTIRCRPHAIILSISFGLKTKILTDFFLLLLYSTRLESWNGIDGLWETFMKHKSSDLHYYYFFDVSGDRT